MGNFLTYILPSFGFFYNQCYAIKGVRWMGKINGKIVKSCYPTSHKVGDKVTFSSKRFFKIRYKKDFPFDLYDRY